MWKHTTSWHTDLGKKTPPTDWMKMKTPGGSFEDGFKFVCWVSLLKMASKRACHFELWREIDFMAWKKSNDQCRSTQLDVETCVFFLYTVYVLYNVYIYISIIKLECPQFPRNSQQKDSHIFFLLNPNLKLVALQHSTGNHKAPSRWVIPTGHKHSQKLMICGCRRDFHEVPHKLHIVFEGPDIQKEHVGRCDRLQYVIV